MGHHDDHEHGADCGCEKQAAMNATAEVTSDQPQQAVETLNDAGDVPGGVRP